MQNKYNIIVIGAGHAGCEAASIAANLGSKVLLITMDLYKVAQMSCNPAIGGIAKGQLVREIDALGGMTAIITDKSTIQFRMLNKSKGPAVWSPRAQCDKQLFSQKWRQSLEQNKNINLWQDNVIELIIENNKVKGVKTELGLCFYSDAVIITAGTFLNGLMHIGKTQIKGGRISEKYSTGITEQLKELGFTSARMKTGTPPRIDANSIDFSKMIEQKADENRCFFSYQEHNNSEIIQEQLSCYIAHTNEEVHNILKKGFNDSPLFSGTIKGIGPRYCPSIEDKIVTFADKDKHQLFLEPEGLDTTEYYINGFSTSLPIDIQIEALHKISGLENCKIIKPGYAIEYDFFQPTQLHSTLETRLIQNLFLAGQINGTTGYEEAAAQGLIAGINAHRKINHLDSFILGREEAYIGVLIDDLIFKGVDEPYRMFTSRAEFRLSLRQDNADIRLTHKAYKIGAINQDRYNNFVVRKNNIEELIKEIKETKIKPEQINKFLVENNSNEIIQSVKLYNIVLRNEIELKKCLEYLILQGIINNVPRETSEIETAEVEIKYEAYLQKEKLMAEKLKHFEELKINPDYDYNQLKSLSTEARQKLLKFKPKTILEAKKISGVSPADIAALLINLGRY